MENEKPIRIQRKRTKGFNLQAESMARNGLPCVYVGRPTKFGNPYKVTDDEKPFNPLKANDTPIYELLTARQTIELFRLDLEVSLKENPNFLDELRGKNLACFCKEGEPCHADILLEMANRKMR